MLCIVLKLSLSLAVREIAFVFLFVRWIYCEIPFFLLSFSRSPDTCALASIYCLVKRGLKGGWGQRTNRGVGTELKAGNFRDCVDH